MALWILRGCVPRLLPRRSVWCPGSIGPDAVGEFLPLSVYPPFSLVPSIPRLSRPSLTSLAPPQDGFLDYVGVSLGSCTVGGLRPAHSYCFRVAAVNALGRGPFMEAGTPAATRTLASFFPSSGTPVSQWEAFCIGESGLFFGNGPRGRRDPPRSVRLHLVLKLSLFWNI